VGHVARMGERRNVGKPAGKRQTAGQSHRCKDNIKMGFKETGCDGMDMINPLNAELNHICCLLALLGAHHFLHVSRIRVKSLTLRLLMSYIYIYTYIYIYMTLIA